MQPVSRRAAKRARTHAGQTSPLPGACSTLPPMRIDAIIDSTRPCFSVEFFPPKTAEGRQQLLAAARQLAELDPTFVSITYGAGGATRDGTVEMERV